MRQQTHAPLSLRVTVEKWPFAAPFRITGYTILDVTAVVVVLERDGCAGRGEAAGVYYLQDDAAAMVRQLENVRTAIEAGMDRASLQLLLPPGGARNAVDCALWELEAQLQQQSAWQLAGFAELQPLVTTFTCGAAAPLEMAATARSYPQARAIKLKLTGEGADAERVQAVREACPGVWLGVDANQGFSRASLERLMPVLMQANVKLIEQPFARGQEALLDGLQSPLPIAADESVQGLADMPSLAGRFDVVNIKLDKCGGLTEGLAMARAAREMGLQPMVGNMLGTSLAMAPAMIVGQLCEIVDLDGPVFLKEDRAVRVQYTDGMVTCPNVLWGTASPSGAGTIKV